MSGYRLTRPAVDDIAAIFVDGLERFGLAQADTHHAELEQAFEFPAQFPRAARERTEVRPTVRAHPHKLHLIVYEIGIDGKVVILRVRHGREDWMPGAF